MGVSAALGTHCIVGKPLGSPTILGLATPSWGTVAWGLEGPSVGLDGSPDLQCASCTRNASLGARVGVEPLA